jgi:hypothetical protein
MNLLKSSSQGSQFAQFASHNGACALGRTVCVILKALQCIPLKCRLLIQAESIGCLLRLAHICLPLLVPSFGGKRKYMSSCSGWSWYLARTSAPLFPLLWIYYNTIDSSALRISVVKNLMISRKESTSMSIFNSCWQGPCDQPQ